MKRSMAVTIRPGSGVADQTSAIALFARHLNPRYDAERFEWLYRRNPAGAGQLWLAVDGETEEVVGTAGVFPRVFSVAGRDIVCWALGDFCVAEGYRALGPALKLQRACLAPAAEPGGGFCYDFPSQAMMTVYRRLGITPSGQVRRFVKLLRVDGKISALAGLPRIGKAIGWLLNGILALRDHRRSTPAGLTVALHEGWCGEEFSRLAESESRWYGVCVKRTAGYLDWRYLANPVERHEILTARLAGRLVAYAVLTCSRNQATLVDLFGTPEISVLGSLIRATAAVARRRGSESLSVFVRESHPWADMFDRLGFVPRESSPFVMALGDKCEATGAAVEPSNLFLMHGDRDS